MAVAFLPTVTPLLPRGATPARRAASPPRRPRLRFATTVTRLPVVNHAAAVPRMSDQDPLPPPSSLSSSPSSPSSPSSSSSSASPSPCSPDYTAAAPAAAATPPMTAAARARLSVPTLLLLSAFAAFLYATHPAAAPARALLLSAPARLSSALAALGPLRAAVLLFCVNFFTVLCCFPANMGLMIAAGALLPSAHAFAALYCSKLAAALASFALARGLLARPAAAWLARRPRLAAALRGAAAGAGPRLVVLLRLSPFPGFLLNYLLPLVGVPLRAYALGTMAGIAPSVANLVLIGSAARQAGNAVSASSSSSAAAAGAAWLGAGIRAACAASMVAVMVVVTRTVGKALKEADTDVDGLASSIVADLDPDDDDPGEGDDDAPTDCYADAELAYLRKIPTAHADPR